MKKETLLQELKDISEKLGVPVQEKNFKTAGIKVKSGFCKVNNEDRFIIDKHKKIKSKIEILAEFISTLNHEDIYVIPVVRETIEKNTKRITGNKS